jgi:hypothetical protein
MAALQMTLWQLVDQLASRMPVSAAKLQDLMKASLNEIARDEDFAHFSCPGPSLNDGVVVSKVDLLMQPSAPNDDESVVAVELKGACIPLSQVRTHYPDLAVTSVPRGRSLEEMTIYSVRWAACDVSFSFREAIPDCLFRVSLAGAPWR